MVLATECVLSVRYAATLEGVKPLKLSVTDCAVAPVLVKTTATVPSVFLNAPIATLETVPVVVRR